MLSDQSRPVIEQTIGVVSERIPFLTPGFYRSMFEARPDLLDGMFCRSTQKNGTQAQALAGSIAMFDSWLLSHPEGYPDELLSRVAHKHTSLGLLPEHYPIVHEHLFGAIARDLGDAATPEVVAAWDEVYWLMADALITIEEGLYAGQANTVAFAPFRVAAQERTGTITTAITLEPADGTPMTPAAAGQYVTVEVRMPDGVEQPRQFTLVPGPEGTRRIAVRLDERGEVTPVLHHDVQVGDVLRVSSPYGVVLPDGDGPLVLASAGIGVTPMLAFLDRLVRQESQRQVLVLHADRSAEEWALRELLVAELPHARLETWMETPGEGDHDGFMDLGAVRIPADAQVVLCGPLPFMKAVRSAVIAQGVPGRSVAYEILGPDQWMLHDEARETAAV
ncbi:globin domain-containing protein [Kocuria arenosa]|uniref:globin domain-containing protein n=1 Tax=Kocuria arenosa TaxID=3071446 RepID=UPI0034D49FF2